MMNFDFMKVIILIVRLYTKFYFHIHSVMRKLNGVNGPLVK